MRTVGPRLKDPRNNTQLFLKGREGSGLDFDFHCQTSSVKDRSLWCFRQGPLTSGKKAFTAVHSNVSFSLSGSAFSAVGLDGCG